MESTRARLIALLLPVIAVATFVSVAGLEQFLSGFFRERVEREARMLSEAVLAALEQQMLRRVPEFTQRTIEDLGAAADIRRILLVNRAGRVAHAYPASERGRVLDPTSDEGCRDCHEPGAVPAARSGLVTDGAGERVLRVATPIENRAPCQQCHGASARLNGMLLVERSARAETEAVALIRSRLGLTWAATLLALAVLIGGVTTVVVHRPVRRLIEATRRIGAGDLTTRVAVGGRGEISELAATLNDMTADLASSLEEVREKTVELTVLYSIVDRMSRALFIGELRPLVLDVVAEVVRAPRVVLVCPAAEPGALEVYERDARAEVRAVTVRGRELDRAALPVPAALVHRWLEGGLADVDVRTAAGFASLPLRFRERELGLLVVAEPDGAPFGPDEIRLLGSLRGHVAIAFENARLYTLAITDELTQLYTVRHFQASLEEAVLRSDRYGEQISLLMLDLDHFKAINDTYGHPAGDVVLREAARRIRESVREADIPCRYGGEEFAVILPHTDALGATAVAERTRLAIAATPVPLADGRAVSITASVGVASYPPHASGTAALVRVADGALYRAKRTGRDRVCCADDGGGPITDVTSLAR